MFMKKIMKKLVTIIMVAILSCVALTSCKKDNGVDLDKENNTTVTEDYPYKDKMYRNCYIIYFATDLRPSLWNLGEDKVDTLVNESIILSGAKKWSDHTMTGICVRFKSGTKLRSITFTVTMLNACYVNPYISGYTTYLYSFDGPNQPFDGTNQPVAKFEFKNGGYWLEENESKTFTLTFGNGEEFYDPYSRRTRTWVNFDETMDSTYKCVGFGIYTQNRDYMNEWTNSYKISNVSFSFD